MRPTPPGVAAGVSVDVVVSAAVWSTDSGFVGSAAGFVSCGFVSVVSPGGVVLSGWVIAVGASPAPAVGGWFGIGGTAGGYAGGSGTTLRARSAWAGLLPPGPLAPPAVAGGFFAPGTPTPPP